MRALPCPVAPCVCGVVCVVLCVCGMSVSGVVCVYVLCVRYAFSSPRVSRSATEVNTVTQIEVPGTPPAARGGHSMFLMVRVEGASRTSVLLALPLVSVTRR